MACVKAADLKSADDRILAQFARDGSEEALKELMSRYELFIRSRAASAGVSGLETDDLFQEGMIGLFSAAKSYRSEGGAAFNTYACLCIKRRMASALRSASRKKNLPLNNSLSLDEETNAQAAAMTNVVNPEDMIVCRENIGALKNIVIHHLTPLERVILRMYLSGVPYAAMAKASHTSIKYIDNSLQRIKRKLLVSAEG